MTEPVRILVVVLFALFVKAVSNRMQVWMTRSRSPKPQTSNGGIWGTIVHDKDAGNAYETTEKEGAEFDAALKAGV